MSKGHGIDADGSLRSGARDLGCGMSGLWKPKITVICHRAPNHAGSHLDTEHDVWFSMNTEGVMVFFPRHDGRTVVTPRGRTTTTRRGT